MVANVKTMLPETPVSRAAEFMLQSRIRHLVVTEADGEVLGVLSQRDILKYKNRGEESQGNDRFFHVHQVMHDAPITISPDASLAQAAGILASTKIGCLPVVDLPRRLVGILTVIDVLLYVANNQSAQSVEEFDGEFEVFTPPAFFNKDGNLTLATEYLVGKTFQHELVAVLAFAAGGNSIGVKLVEKKPDGEPILGARSVTISEDLLIIPAKDFFDRYKLKSRSQTENNAAARRYVRGPFDVTKDKKTGYFVLTPAWLIQPTAPSTKQDTDLSTDRSECRDLDSRDEPTTAYTCP